MRASFALLLLWAASASAAAPLVRVDALAPALRESWRGEIARARKANAEAFAKVELLSAEVEALEETRRGRMAVIAPRLERLGPEALWPLVERLVFDAGAPAPGSDGARLSLAVGLVEAAGALRDARLAPLWTALLKGAEPRFEVLRAAAAALARLDTEEAAGTLIAASREGGLGGEAARAAMGHCRRLPVARALAEALDAQPPPLTAKRLTRSLGDVGSAWAWRTPGLRGRSEEGVIRRLAAEALLRAYLAYDGEVRQGASNALLMVDAPELPTLIASARQGADAPRQARLDALSERLRRNPLR